jgi:hypothetical protein
VAIGNVILDFGCGIGRIAKEMLSKADVTEMRVSLISGGSFPEATFASIRGTGWNCFSTG